MSTEVQILVHSETGLLESHAASSDVPAVIEAQEDVTYEIKNPESEIAPQEFTVKRNGDDLELFADPAATVPLAVVGGYFLLANPSPLVGVSESGEFFPFVPQTGDVADLPWNLEDGASSSQSLGYDTPGSFVPWWPFLLAGLLLLGGAAAAGRSSSSSKKGGAVAPDKPVIDDITNNYDDNGNLTDTTITGEATPGDKVVIKDKDGETVGEADVDDDGNFEITVPGGLEDGKDYDVTAEDKGGNKSEPETITGDTKAPDKPIIDEVKNNFDKDGDVESTTITGEAEPDSKVEITDKDGNVVGETTADKDGNFEITVPDGGLGDGDNYNVTATDDHNNTSGPEDVVGDTEPPNISGIIVEQWDTSDPANGKFDEDTETVVIFKADDPEAKYLVTDESGREADNVTANGDGTYTAIFTPALDGSSGNNSKNIIVTGTDPYGNEASEKEPIPEGFTHYSDNTGPNTPEIEGFANDHDENKTTIKGKVTRDEIDDDGNTTTKVEANATIEVFDKEGNKIGEGKTDEDGNFIVITDEILKDGEEYTVVATDSGGNNSDPATIEGDTTPPPAPIITDNGENSGTVTGETDKNAIIANKDGEPIHDDNGEPYQADNNGKFEIPKDKIPDDDTITAVDDHNNVSDPTNILQPPSIQDALDAVDENGDQITEEDNYETFKSGGHTNDDQPLFEIPATVADSTDSNFTLNERVLIINDEVVSATVVTINGKTYLKPGAPLGEGEYSVSYTTDDSINLDDTPNSNDISGGFTFTVDTTPPPEPTGVFIGEDGNNYITANEIKENADGEAVVEVKISLPDTAGANEELPKAGDILKVNNIEHVLTQEDLDEGLVTLELPSPGEGNTLEVNAEILDAANNASGQITESAEVDTIPPVVEITNPDDNGEVTGVVTNAESGAPETNAILTDKDGNPLLDANNNPITTDANGEFVIPTDSKPEDGLLGAKDDAGNQSEIVNITTPTAIEEAYDKLDGYREEYSSSTDYEKILEGEYTNDSKPYFIIPSHMKDSINPNVLVIDGKAVAAELKGPINVSSGNGLAQKQVFYLAPINELSDDNHSISYTTEQGNISAIDPSGPGVSEAYTISVDTIPPEVSVERLPNEGQDTTVKVKVSSDEAGDIVIKNENGDIVGSGTAVADGNGDIADVEIQLDQSLLENGEKITVSITDQAGNIGTNDSLPILLSSTLAVDNHEELVLDAIPTEKNMDGQPDSLIGQKAINFGVAAAGLGGVADAGVLNFDALINATVEEGTERKLKFFADGGGISIGQVFDLVVLKEDEYGNWKFYQVHEEWFTIPFLGNTKEGSITLNDPGNYAVFLSGKAGVGVLAGSGLEVIEDTIFDYNHPESVSGETSGNVLTDINNFGANLGQDIYDKDHTTVTNISFEGTEHPVPSNGILEIEGKYGILTIDPTGKYTYELKEDALPNYGDTEIFEYTITNSETGDSSSANLTIELVQNPSNVLPSANDTLWLDPATEEIPIDDGDKLSSKSWSEIAGVGLGIADVSAVIIENGMDIHVGENQVRDISFSGAGGAPVAIGYTPVTFAIYKLEQTEHGDFWQLYTVQEDWWGIVGVVIGAGQSSENINVRLDEGQYKAVLIPNTAGIAVIPTVTLKVKSDTLYEHKATNNELSGDVDLGGFELYGVDGVLKGDASDITVQGEYGTLVINSDGSYTYTLKSNFDSKNIGAVDTFSYSMKDPVTGQLKTSTLNITINSVQAVDDVDRAGFGMDNIESYEGWSVDTRTSGSSTKTYAKDINVGENQIFDLTFDYNLNQVGTVLGGADQYIVRLIDADTGVVIETHLDVKGSKGEKGSWQLHLPEGNYRIEVIVDPRAANQQNVKFNLSGTTTSLDDFRTEADNHDPADGNLLANDGYEQYGQIEVNGKPLAIITDDKFNNNPVKSVTVEGEHGTLTVHQDGSYTYKANGSSYGVDEFDYKLISINGSSSSAKLSINAGMNAEGSKYDDVITSSAGDDTFTLGGGSDTVIFDLLDAEDATGGNGTDTWTDFRVGDINLDAAADQIDVAALLDGANTSNIEEYLELGTNDDGDLVLRVDRDGAGNAYEATDLLVLEGVDINTTLQDLLDNEQIIY